MREDSTRRFHHFQHHHLPKPVRIIGWVTMGLTLAFVFAFVFAFFVQWLWNHLMPDIFGLKMISYWQAFGLILLAKLFFGGSSHKPGSRRRKHPGRWSSHAARWKRHFPCADMADGDWQYYDQYWQEQGKAAFEAYVQQRKQPSPPQE